MDQQELLQYSVNSYTSPASFWQNLEGRFFRKAELELTLLEDLEHFMSTHRVRLGTKDFMTEPLMGMKNNILYFFQKTVKSDTFCTTKSNFSSSNQSYHSISIL